MLILLSPAKSLNYQTSNSYPNFTIPHFAKEANQLAAELKKFTVSNLEKMMKISQNLAVINHARFQNFSHNFDFKNSKQALLAFDGDVYKPIEVEKFDDADFIFAQKNLRILSGFYGILRPLDLMQPYRLEMSTVFDKNFFTKNLYQFWGDKISQQLNLDDAKYIINLASEEYFAAVNQKKILAKIINISFKEAKNNSYKTIGIHAKKARGLMTNFIIKNKISNPEDLKKFKLENYFFEKDLSSQFNFVFVR